MSNLKLRFCWFGGGLVLSVMTALLVMSWMSVVRWITEQPNLIYYAQPDWLKLTESIVGWIPLASAMLVVILRFTLGSWVKIFSFWSGLALPYILLVGYLVLGPSVSNYVHKRDFDSAIWKSQSSVKHDPLWPPRLTMVDDLMSSRRLDGLTEAAVQELLGPPQEKGFPLDVSPEDTHYYLGPERGLIRIDSEWLVIRLSSDRKVERYWIYRD
jgi:hypothetical protein